MRTKDTAIIEIKHLKDDMTRLRLSLPAKNGFPIGFSMTLDIEASVLRDSWSMFTEDGLEKADADLVVAAQILALPFAQQVMALTDDIWPTWRVDFQRIAAVGGRFRAGNGFVAIKFGDGGTRRIEVKAAKGERPISERLGDVLDQARVDLDALVNLRSGGYAGGSVAVPVYAPTNTDTALAEAFLHEFNPS